MTMLQEHDQVMNGGLTRCTAYVGTLLIACLITGCLSDVKEATPDVNANTPGAQNTAPTISGSPSAAVTMGQDYDFTPNASDADGDSLVFSVQNLPSWANFDSLTGRVSGQPSLANVGDYANITISVSDGMVSATLPQFGIAVTQGGLGSVTVSWTPPTQNEDGSTLTDLAGYNIYYGTSAGDYQSSIRINSAGVASYVVENLVPDTYYFASTAFNSSGIESSFSNEAVKVVN